MIEIFQQYGPALLKGFGMTNLCGVLGTIGGMGLGLGITLLQRYAMRPVCWLLRVYVEVIRGTPCLVRMFVLYDGRPLFGLRLDALPAGLLGLSV